MTTGHALKIVIKLNSLAQTIHAFLFPHALDISIHLKRYVSGDHVAFISLPSWILLESHITNAISIALNLHIKKTICFIVQKNAPQNIQQLA